MSDSEATWGCCSEIGYGEKYLSCSRCNENYHFSCVGASEEFYTPKRCATWKCPSCISSLPRKRNDENTPVRNVSTSRANKRQAVNSPPEIQRTDPVTREDISHIVQSIVQSKFDDMLSKLNNTLIDLLQDKLKPIQNEMVEIIKSMEHMNEQFEEVLMESKTTQETIKALKIQNDNLKITVSELNNRLSQLEQHSRAKNIEIQCVPEKKHENLVNIVTDVAKVVKCSINKEQILNCTRVAKLHKEANRPRSIIVEFVTPRLRDEMLAAVIKYNKANKDHKLNSSLIGIQGAKTQIYVTEHLSPANKALHAAARIKAKQMNYRFTWVRGGRIFVRKDEESSFIWIKETSSLDKII